MMTRAAITQIENIEAQIAKIWLKFTIGFWFKIFIFLGNGLSNCFDKISKKIHFYMKFMHFKR